MVYVGNVNLEPHYKVHNYQNPQVDRAMRRFFMVVFPQKLGKTTIDDITVPVFPPFFECALLVGHMVNHVYAEGLGLRQLVDFMRFIQKEYKAVTSEECKTILGKMQMERAFRVFVCISEEYLGLSHKLLNLDFSSKEKKFVRVLMDDILKVGNFGRGSNYLCSNKILMPIKSYFWVFGRCIRLGYLCPAEARWWPISKFIRYFNGKLFNKR